jgi:hypothetical protein
MRIVGSQSENRTENRSHSDKTSHHWFQPVLSENQRIVNSRYFRIIELTSSGYFNKSKSKNQSVLGILKMWRTISLCWTPVLSKFFDFLSFGRINLGARVEHKMKIVAYIASLIIGKESALYLLNLDSFQVL